MVGDGVWVVTASCGRGPYSAPRDLDDACAIVQERPQVYRA